MDSSFGFLTSSQADALRDILGRRNAALLNRIQASKVVTRSDAEMLVSSLSDELTDNLDDEWEPTEYGRVVSGILSQVNSDRIAQWPS